MPDITQHAALNQPDDDGDDGRNEQQKDDPEAPADARAVLLFALLAREPGITAALLATTF